MRNRNRSRELQKTKNIKSGFVMADVQVQRWLEQQVVELKNLIKVGETAQ